MKFQLITLSGVKYSGDAYAVVLPSMAGELAVLDHHEPLMSALKTGIITIRKTATDPDYHWENYARQKLKLILIMHKLLLIAKQSGCKYLNCVVVQLHAASNNQIYA
jgi:hypothetical protein